MTHCRACDRPLRGKTVRKEEAPNTVRIGARGLCSSCYLNWGELYSPLDTRELACQRWRDIFEDLEWIAGTPSERAKRVGKTVLAIAAAGYRYGRPDIGRQFNRVYKRNYRQRKREMEAAA